MIDSDVLKSLIVTAITDADLEIQISGNHCQLKVISADFSGLNSLKRQQKVYACLHELIADGTVHAVNMNLYTPEEWQQAKKFLS